MATSDPAATYFAMTVSICPECHVSLPASLLEQAGRIYLSRTCPTHGRFTTLIASDAAWYHEAQRETSPSSGLRHHQTRVAKGCPHDCGVCPEHRQNNAAPVIEITNVCNIECPICFASNLQNYMIGDDELERCLDVIERSGTAVDVLIFMGGEPTAHPRLAELIDRARRRPFIPRVAIATNGILLAKKEELARMLAERQTDVILQLDSADPEKNRALRGKGMVELRERALANLERHGVHTTVLMTAVKGLNDDELGAILRFCLARPHIGGFEVQAISYTGKGGRHLAFDPLERLTGTDLIRLIEEQSDGLLRRSDFVPMPHPHPNCIALSYLLRLVDGSFVPFPRFVERARFKQAITGMFIAAPDERHEALLRETIDRAWVSPESVHRAELILATLKQLLGELYPPGGLPLEKRLRTVERYVKHVFLHQMMDDHCFDAAVLRKCTSMQVLPDGRMIPHCGYRVIHRPSDPRWQGARAAAIGHGVDGLRAGLELVQP